MRLVLKDLWSNNKGQGIAEYGLILALFVVFVAGGLALLGPKVAALFANTNNQFE